MKNLAQQIAKSLNKKPTTLQLEIEAEKEQREKERRQMKELEVGELLKYNKEKVKNVENPSVNKIDDCDALVGFSEALTYSEKTAELHHNLKATKGKLHYHITVPLPLLCLKLNFYESTSLFLRKFTETLYSLLNGIQ